MPDDFSESWRARGPIAGAGASDKAQQRLENSIGSEAQRSTGGLIPVPDLAGTAQLQSDIQDLAGRTSLVPSARSAAGMRITPTRGDRTGTLTEWDQSTRLHKRQVREQLADGIAASLRHSSRTNPGGC